MTTAPLLIFCTLYGTRNIVYAFDARGIRLRDIPISEMPARLTPTIDVMGLIVPSSAATFDNDGYIIRMQIRLPADFDPVHTAKRTIESGPARFRKTAGRSASARPGWTIRCA